MRILYDISASIGLTMLITGFILLIIILWNICKTKQRERQDNKQQKITILTKKKNDDTLHLINRTPHDIILLDSDNNIVRTIKKTKTVFRLKETIEKENIIDGVIVVSKTYFAEEGLPTIKKNVYYIVSAIMATTIHRPDFLVPNTIRDTDGKIIGCNSLAKILS